MKPTERLLVCLAILCALLAILNTRPSLPEARAEPEPAAPENTIAVCDIWRLTYDLASSDRFTERRTEYEQLREEITALWEKLEKAREDYEEAEPGDDEQDHGDYYALSNEYSSLQQNYKEIQDRVFGKLINESREMVVTSARAVAEDLGYTYLIAMHEKRDPDEVASYRTTWQLHLSDPIILYPDAADLTPDVRDDLNLD